MMPTPEAQKRRTKIALGVASLAVFLSLAASGVALVVRFNDTNARRDQAHQRDVRIAAVALQDCHEIEALKKAQRDKAIDDYQHLDVNAKLLGIKVTPELRRAAADARDTALRRFAPEACPRKLVNNQEVKP